MRRHKKIKSFNDFLFNAFDITKRNHCTISFNAFDITRKIVARFPFLESATVALQNRVYEPDGQSVHAPLGS